MYTLYSMQRSGNCYKARLALAQLGVPYTIVDLDILKGDTRTPEFLAMNPGGRELQIHALEDWMEKGYQAFSVMEKHLATNDFFAAGHYTIADIALYGYTHVAHECDFELAAFPAIRAWLNRIVDQPGHVPMDWHPAAEAAE
jgi:glutathione S-transferase